MKTNIFAEGHDYFDTIVLFEELGFVCKENSTDTSAMCLNYDTHMVFRVNQMDDSDRDGVVDGKDCRPNDPAFQDILAPQIGDMERTLNGYRLDDYYFHNGNWHVRASAKPVFQRSRLGFKIKEKK